MYESNLETAQFIKKQLIIRPRDRNVTKLKWILDVMSEPESKSNRYIPIVNFLLDSDKISDLEINLSDFEIDTFLLFVLTNNYDILLELLLQEKRITANRILHKYLVIGNMETKNDFTTCELLLRNKNTTIDDDMYQVAIEIAIKSQCFDFFCFLFQGAKNVFTNSVHHILNDVLIKASLYNNYDIVRMILQDERTDCSHDYHQALRIACKNENIRIVKILISRIDMIDARIHLCSYSFRYSTRKNGLPIFYLKKICNIIKKNFVIDFIIIKQIIIPDLALSIMRNIIQLYYWMFNAEYFTYSAEYFTYSYYFSN